MFLNVSLSAGGGDATAPKTPEILNSLISLTSPPLPPHYSHYQSGTSELLSPDCSTPGDDIGGGGGGSWGAPEEGGPPMEAGGVCERPLGYATLRGASTALGSQFPTSSLLTPTSDGSSPPPPPTSSHHGLPHAPVDFPSCRGVPRGAGDLPSPVSTVEATRSALIKEGLKLQITSKLQQTGTDPDSLLKPDPAVVKTELTLEDEERRRRRRERNKLAATKCRNKKKEMTEILMSESESVADLNVRLKGEVERLKSEKERLEKSLTDARHRLNCKHHRQYDPSQIPSLNMALPSVSRCSSTASPTYPPLSSITSPSYASPSSSSCCSASSPNSFTSLLSPSADSKDFINSLPSPSSLPLADCGLGTMYVASTASSLDYIEPTISPDTATSLKPTGSSKSKGSHRYHPYLYPTSPTSIDAPMRQEPILVDYPSASRAVTLSSSNSSVVDNAILTCTSGATVAQSYSDDNTTLSYAYTDTTTNPFCYPVVTSTSCSNYQQLSSSGKQYIQLETACANSSYRKSRTQHAASSCTSSRYTPYSLNSMRHGSNEANMSSLTIPLSEANQPRVVSAIETSLPQCTVPSDNTDVCVAISTMGCGIEPLSNTVACGSQLSSLDTSLTCASNVVQPNIFFPTTYGTCDSQ